MPKVAVTASPDNGSLVRTTTQAPVHFWQKFCKYLWSHHYLFYLDKTPTRPGSLKKGHRKKGHKEKRAQEKMAPSVD